MRVLLKQAWLAVEPQGAFSLHLIRLSVFPSTSTGQPYAEHEHKGRIRCNRICCLGPPVQGYRECPCPTRGRRLITMLLSSSSLAGVSACSMISAQSQIQQFNCRRQATASWKAPPLALMHRGHLGCRDSNRCNRAQRLRVYYHLLNPIDCWRD